MWLDAPGVVLDAPLLLGAEHPLWARWRAQVLAVATALDWPVPVLAVRHHRTGTTLAFTAPLDALLTATSVNEWALLASADALGVAHDATAIVDEVPPIEQASAITWLRERAASERGTIPPDIITDARPGVPIALVTGSNGKTTTTRLIAAMLRTDGHRVGYCCTDGVFVDNVSVATGDYSGPEGARRVLSDPRVTAAVLETARGGMLRRGLVVPRADAAVITNVAADHFGDYGIDSLEELAEAKAVVAKALGPDGVLVMNGDDPTLRTLRPSWGGRVAWFSADGDSDLLPPFAEIPLAMGGAARYNVANADGAALAAQALGVSPEAIRNTLRTFGSDNADNAGRLERFEVAGMRIWIDYAHNPHGLAALLDAARAQIGGGRLGLLLGQAGDRDDEAIRALARTAWEARPDHIVLKDLDGYLRGRQAGEVPALLRAELLAAGAALDQIEDSADETDAVRRLLAWGRAGDLLVMPVHALAAREKARGLLLAFSLSHG